MSHFFHSLFFHAVFFHNNNGIIIPRKKTGFKNDIQYAEKEVFCNERRKENMKPIYKTKGLANEYCELAINIYTGCPHGCWYCSVFSRAKTGKDTSPTDVKPREGIVENTRAQIKRENITGQIVHLCFTCDPYPTGYDSSATREIIKVLKEAGNYVQILTKGDGTRDFDLLGEGDWYGVTIDGSEPQEKIESYMDTFRAARKKGIGTWVSFEPVLDADRALSIIRTFRELFDKVKIGKLNYYPSEIDWKKFAKDANTLCRELGITYALKSGLKELLEDASEEVKIGTEYDNSGSGTP